jgi:NNP family nitrate/nitrite transporter-like MFS transporter
MSAADGTKNTEEPSSIPSYGALLSPTESRRAAQAQNRVIPTSHRLLIPPNQSDGLPPHEHRRRNIGALTISPNLKQGADQDDFSDSDDDIDSVFTSKERLLDKIQEFTLAYNPDRGYRATEFKFFSFSRPHMRAMHASWICYFASYFVQFSMAPILPYLQESLHLTQRDIWLTNVWMVVGCVPMQFILGSLCDTYGPRVVMVWMLVLSAIPCALSGIVVVDLNSLLILRFLMGAMDAFVPCQCWITSHFDREVGGTVMAIAGGLGATGSGFSNLVVGLLFALCVVWTGGDADLAWRLALLFPAAFALVVAYLSYYYSDDCPLGNFVDVKKAGLMMQRSAVDSFRSGVYNLNAWLLFLQYAGSCGVDITMCNGCAVYFHARFSQSIATSGAMAFLYSISAVYARALGGYISDQLGTVFSLRGRLWGQFLCMLVQGCLNIWFAKSANLVHSLIIMVVFSVLVQVSGIIIQADCICYLIDTQRDFDPIFMKTHLNVVLK